MASRREKWADIWDSRTISETAGGTFGLVGSFFYYSEMPFIFNKINIRNLF